MSSVLTYNGHGLKLMTSSGYVRVSGEKYDPVPKAEITSSFDPSTDPYGVLFNSNFKTDAGLRRFR